MASGPSWSWAEGRGAVATASPEPPAAPPEPKRRKKLTALLGSVTIAVTGGGGWLAIGASSGDGGPPSIAPPGQEAQVHPSAPFRRGAPPFKQSGIGLASGSPFGYEWSDDGSLTLEMWVYNAERFAATLDCDVAVSTPEQLVAQSSFPSIEGRVPPGVTRPVLLTFAASEAPGRFADLSVSSINTRCRWSSR